MLVKAVFISIDIFKSCFSGLALQLLSTFREVEPAVLILFPVVISRLIQIGIIYMDIDLCPALM